MAIVNSVVAILVCHFVFGIKHGISFFDWVNDLSITKGGESES